jgi:hypothetical protein
VVGYHLQLQQTICLPINSGRCIHVLSISVIGSSTMRFLHPNILNNISCGILLTPFWSVKHSTRTVAVLSGQARTVRGLGSDGPRPGAGARVSCLTVGRSARTQGRRKIAGGAWISLPGGTPSGRRDPTSCLGSGRPT